jgi:hypothetical protein
MSKETTSLASIVVGIILLGLSIYWATSSAPPASYTREDAEAFIREGGRLHDMTFQTKPQGTSGAPAVSAEALEAQRKKYEEQKATLDSARSRTQITRWVLMGAGLVFTMGGLFMYRIISE